MTSESPRILIGTLYCGENEFDALKHSLQEQTYPHWEHVVFKNLPNKEAHDRLYQTFMDQADDFDLFVKLDADMVFRSSDALQQVVWLFEENSSLDHAVLAVHDWYSNTLIEGIHVFSNRARWAFRDEERFVDHNPIIPGDRVRFWSDPAPVVDHSPNPSPFQAFRFGVHRALKALQPEQWKMRYRQARFQWTMLTACWKHFSEVEDQRLGLALLGAERVFGGDVQGSDYDNNQDNLRTLLDPYRDFTSAEIEQRLQRKWGSRWMRTARYVLAVGPLRLAVARCYQAGHELKQRI